MATKYLAKNHLTIEAVEIERETASNVWVKNLRNITEMRKKHTADGWYDFFDNLEEAKSHILNKRKYEIKEAKKRIETAEDIIAKIEKMKTVENK